MEKSHGDKKEKKDKEKKKHHHHHHDKDRLQAQRLQDEDLFVSIKKLLFTPGCL